MRSIICTSAAVLALVPVAVMAENFCLTLDPASEALGRQSATLETLLVDLRFPEGGAGMAMALAATFRGDGPEAPGAVAGAVYRQDFGCASAEDGWICAPECGAGQVRFYQREDYLHVFAMDGLNLTGPDGAACGQPWTTTGTAGTAWDLYEVAPGDCAFAGES